MQRLAHRKSLASGTPHDRHSHYCPLLQAEPPPLHLIPFSVWQECFTPFINGSFFEHDGQPYCEVHYHERRGSLCSGCQKPITGRCITAMAKKFHPEHFVCAFCLKQLNKGTFKEQNDKPYCQNCFLKLFC